MLTQILRVVLLFLFLFYFSSSNISANHLPPPIGYVNDFAAVLNDQQRSSLDNLLKEYEQNSTNEIAVVTIKNLAGGNIDDFAVRVFEEWKIGKKGKDNGILLLASIEERQMRIEIGYGLEPYLTDGEAGAIIRDKIAPQFQKGDYYTGINLGIESIMQELVNGSKESYSWSSWLNRLLELDPNLLILLLSPLIVIMAIIVLKIVVPLLNRINPSYLQVFDQKINKYRLPKRPSEKRLVFWMILYYLLLGIFVFRFLTDWRILLVGSLLIYFCAFLARSKEFWLGGVIGGIVGFIIGFLVNQNLVLIITLVVLLGGGGLIIDFILSRNYKRLKATDQPTGFWSSWGGFKGFGGYGGGSSGGGGASGRW